MKALLIIFIVFFALFILFSGSGYVSFTHYKTKVEYKIEYIGLLWVTLDYWIIKKYQSDDKPMKWLKFTKIEHFKKG